MRYYTCDILRNLKITSRLPLSLPLTALWNNHYKLLHIEACSSKKFHYYCLKYCSAKHFVANIPYSLHWNCLFQRGQAFINTLARKVTRGLPASLRLLQNTISPLSCIYHGCRKNWDKTDGIS